MAVNFYKDILQNNSFIPMFLEATDLVDLSEVMMVRKNSTWIADWF